jgi:predicted nucleic acid-binding protein
MIALDTNVLSEATKREPDGRGTAWFSANQNMLWLPTVTLAELRAGAAMLDRGKRRTALEHQFDAIESVYSDRLLSFDAACAACYARVLESAKRSGKPILTADAMIAATALRNGMAVATRDTGDFAGAGVELVNPWET